MYKLTSLRFRLMLAFLIVGVLPVLLVGSVGVVIEWQRERRRVMERLNSRASLIESKVDSWSDKVISAMKDLRADGETIGYTILALSDVVAANRDVWDQVIANLSDILDRYVEQSALFDAIMVMNEEGQVVFSTDRSLNGKWYRYQDFFRDGLAKACVRPAMGVAPPPGMRIVVALPIFDDDGNIVGVMAGRVRRDSLHQDVLSFAGSGGGIESYMVGPDFSALTPTYLNWPGMMVYTEGARAALKEHKNGIGMYTNYAGRSVIGVYRWLPGLQMALLVERGVGEAFRPVFEVVGGSVTLVLIAAMFSVLASLFVTRNIADPLVTLADTAIRISEGELDLTVELDREDEIGLLARAFNGMTARLRSLIGSLEDRVAERTRDLEQRSAYLEAAAEVGRVAASILDPNTLINRVVGLIQERFDLYYVGLFLLDESGEWAVLRAGTGEAGRKMLARGHRIKVGEGMIGWSIANAQARIALDVGRDAVRLATPELPDTRSEAALPLRSRGRVLGAFTVQSERSAAFDQHSVVVLQTMADQVAVALDNARLFSESRDALDAARRAYSELSRREWAELLRMRPDLGFRGDEYGVMRIGELWRPEMEQALASGQSVYGDGKEASAPGGRRYPLAVPIRVRGEVIGVLDTFKPEGTGGWTEEEVALLEEIADRLGQALEGARLFEDARRRNIRERQLREISERMQRAVALDSMMRSVVEELGRALNVPLTFVQLAPGMSQFQE